MILKLLWELLFPPKCVLCRNVLSKEELDLCRVCRRKAPAYDGRRDKLRFVKKYTAVWYYEDTVRRSLLRYKFHNARSYSQCYGRMMAMKITEDLPEEIDLVTWVPIGPKRKRKRGYDQVELLAEAVSQELAIPAGRLLRKPRDNKPQSGLDTAESRRANVLGVYEICDPEMIRDRDILLLDDIVTTGATLSECARMLQGAGAKNVYCAAVAAVRNQKQ